MGTLFGFAVGYIVGARAGSQGFDEVVEALRTVRDSDEFQALQEVLRTHVRGSVRTLGAWLSTWDDTSFDTLVERAKERARRG
jgi:hypothetical protein